MRLGIIWTRQTGRFFSGLLCRILDHVPMLLRAEHRAGRHITHFRCMRCGERGIV